MVNILIVEDSIDDQDLYGRLLQTMPGGKYRCTFAADAPTALALIATTNFDCVLVDYALPGMDGLTLLRRIRRMAEFLPLVMLTGQAREDRAASILEAGAHTYIDKAAIDQKHLHDAITAAICASARPHPAAPRASLALLIIDDSPDDRERYARLLAPGRTAPIVEAASGLAGLALLNTQEFEAILLDFGLPGMDGLEVLARIRRGWPFVPVVFITGNGNVAVAVKALQIGANEYLVKSAIDADALNHAIDASVAKCMLSTKDAQILTKSQALHASEERNRLMLDSLSEDAIITLDPDGLVQSWNLTSQRIRGYAAAEIIGQTYAVFFEPEDIAAGVPAAILDTVRKVGRHSVEGWRRRKDGSRMFASVVTDAIRDGSGNLVCFADVTRDITELAAERAALHLANERITMAADSGGIGIWDYHLGNGDLFWDAWMYQLYGMAQEQTATYDLWQAAIHPADRAAAEEALRESLEGIAPFNTSFRIVWPDGSLHHIRASGHVKRDAAGRAVRMIGTNWDVTEAREQAAQLAAQAAQVAEARDAAEKASRAKSRFLAGMSHELRTPLNGILGNARLLQLEGGLQPAQTTRVDSMLGAGSHLLEMIQCVLDLSEIESDRMALQTAPVELRVLAQACVDMIRHMADAHGLTLNLSVAADVPVQAIADPVRLRQILLNLLGNAAKFTLRGGIDLRLRTTGDGAGLRFDVADTGPGIPPSKRHRLFQDFARLQSGDNRNVEGAGLGLALSARLAALMGGKIDHVENPGGGSIFWLELPLLACRADEPTIGAASPLAAAKPGEPRQLRVLVVDDSEMNLDIAASFLRLMGHKVTCAGSGAEAIAVVGEACFDVVFMDVQMPDMDGLEATRRIRALPGPSAEVPVIALTAQVFTEQLEQCRQEGMSGHLAKPFTMAALYAILAEMVPGSPPDRRANPFALPHKQEAGLPVIDLHIFNTNTRLLKPASVIRYLKNISSGAGALLPALRLWGGSGEIGEDVLTATHKLAGNVGLFGFARAAAAARDFERAARAGEPTARLLGEKLTEALELTAQEADSRLAAARGADRPLARAAHS